MTLPQPPFEIPPAPKPITSAARVPVTTGKAVGEASTAWWARRYHISACSVSDWDEVGA